MTKDEFYKIIKNCKSCQLCKLSKNDPEKRLLPNGYIDSNFMLAGISPSADADSSKLDSIYFFDKSQNKTFERNRNLLIDTFSKFNIDFVTMWKTNMQKCSPENNDLNKDNFDQCYMSIFLKEIEVVKPKVIFALGAEVANILGMSELKFGDIKYSNEFNCHIVKMYHPAYHTRGGIGKEDYINQLDDIREDLKIILIKNSYINFHHHNQFSFRDGLGTEKDVIRRLRELKYPGFCLTNHGNISAHFRQYNESNKYGIKPIFGNEAYYCPTTKQINELKANKDKESIQKRKEFAKETYHITIIAKNETGYYNLIKISNKSWIENFYKFPRVDDDLIEANKEGLIILSGCIGGYIPKNLIRGNENLAIEKAKKYKAMLGEDFYIEIQSTDYEPQKEANEKLCKLAKDLEIKIIVTSDTHYIDKGDDDVQQVMLLNNQGLNIDDLNDPNSKAWKFTVKDLFIKSIDDLFEDFHTKLNNKNFDKRDFINSMMNINELFCKIESFELDNSLKLPKIYDNSEQKFYELIDEGIDFRKLKRDDRLKSRLKEEMDIIKSLNFIDYFLIIQDIINWTKGTFGKYKVGPGRGSAAGSLVNYILNITDVNPLEHDMLLFERFISPGRKDLVDIDIDFSPDIRVAVKEYIINRFGREHVCTIGNYQTIKVKSAIQDVFRTLNIPFSKVVDVTREIGNLSAEDEELSISEIADKFKSLRKLLNEYPQAEKYIDKLKGLIRSFGQHAAGVIVSSNKLTENIPLVLTSSKEVVSANTEGGDFHELTSMGYIKYDLLSLTALKLMFDSNELIKSRHGFDLDWNEGNFDDDRMYGLLKQGDTYGIFQFASKLATDYLKKMIPLNLNDLCAASALLRPGPLDQGMHIEYSSRKNKKKKWNTLEPLREILDPTLGIIIYQEQILRICQDLAGFSKEEANVFRKALVKYEKAPEFEKKRLKRVDSFANKLKKGLENHVTVVQAEELWELIESFARYGFNYAHSLSYSIISHRQLFQKFFFPLEFYCSILNNESINDYQLIIKKINQFRARKIDYTNKEVIGKFKIKILPPSLEKLNGDFIIEGEKSIRHGLAKIKFVSDKSFNVIRTHLKQEDIHDINKLLDATYINNEKNKKILDKKVLLAFLYSGAFNYLNIKTNDIIDIFNNKRKYTIPHIESVEDKIEKEENYLGYSMTNDIMLFDMRKEFLKHKYANFNLDELYEEEDVISCADLVRVSDITNKKTKKNNKNYRIVEVDNSSNKYSPIFVWSEKIKLKKNKIYISIFSKNNNFVNLMSAEVIDA